MSLVCFMHFNASGEEFVLYFIYIFLQLLHTTSTLPSSCSFILWGLCNMIFYVPHGAMFMTKCMVRFNKYKLKWIELMFRDFHPRSKAALQRPHSKAGEIQIHSPSRLPAILSKLLHTFPGNQPFLSISPGPLLPTAHFSQRKTAVFGFKFPSGKFIHFILRGQRKEFCIRSFPWGNENKKSFPLIFYWDKRSEVEYSHTSISTYRHKKAHTKHSEAWL